MDLYAYLQMNDLSNILASTGIEIPRLRGLRLMADTAYDSMFSVLDDEWV